MLSRKEYVLVVGVLCAFAAGIWAGASHASPAPPYSPWMNCPKAVKLGKVFTCHLYVRNNLNQPLQLQGCLDYRELGGGPGATIAIGCWASKYSNIPFGNQQDALRWSGKPWAFTITPHKTKSFYFQVKMIKQAPCIAASLYAPGVTYLSGTKLKCPAFLVHGTA
jgi:hypothetical protein